MRKCRWILLLVLVTILACSGCQGNDITKDFPDNTDLLARKTYKNPDNAGNTFEAVSFENRIFIPYGILSNKVDGRDVDECIGHIIRSSGSEYQVFTLIEDLKHDYLMVCQVVDGEIHEADFWRATDTRGFKIETPPYIDSLQYDYWGND